MRRVASRTTAGLPQTRHVAPNRGAFSGDGLHALDFSGSEVWMRFIYTVFVSLNLLALAIQGRRGTGHWERTVLDLRVLLKERLPI